MKRVMVLVLAGMLCGCGIAETARPAKLPPNVKLMSHEISPASRFIFFAVLEGLYEDGVSSEDAGRLLMKEEGKWYLHFIYSCPICMATVAALETYQARPENPFRWKAAKSTFGRGLPESIRGPLWSGNLTERLRVVNALVQKWIQRRLETLPAREREQMVAALEEARRQGMRALKSFRESRAGPGPTLEEFAPGYRTLDECAACNGAVGMSLPVRKKPSDTD